MKIQVKLKKIEIITAKILTDEELKILNTISDETIYKYVIQRKTTKNGYSENLANMTLAKQGEKNYQEYLVLKKIEAYETKRENN